MYYCLVLGNHKFEYHGVGCLLEALKKNLLSFQLLEMPAFVTFAFTCKTRDVASSNLSHFFLSHIFLTLTHISPSYKETLTNPDDPG